MRKVFLLMFGIFFVSASMADDVAVATNNNGTGAWAIINGKVYLCSIATGDLAKDLNLRIGKPICFKAAMETTE